MSLDISRIYFSNQTHVLAAIAVSCRDANVRHIEALIIGPPGTPYEFGFFSVSPRPSSVTHD